MIEATSIAPILGLSGKAEIRRSEFSALVWAHTMRDLARTVGCSDVLLYKFCRKWNVPTPTKAERGKLMSGKPVPQRELPRLAGKADDPVVLLHHEGRCGLTWPEVKPKPRRTTKPDALDFALAESRKSEWEYTEPPTEVFILKILDWFVDYRVWIPFKRADLMYWNDEAGLSFKCIIVSPEPMSGREADVSLAFVSCAISELSDTETLYVGWINEEARNFELMALVSQASLLLQMVNTGKAHFLKIEALSEPPYEPVQILGFCFASRLEQFESEAED